ncbi:choice-of-anchor J domain-containing protein [Chryseobacterium sp.]|uniref:T9SS-dependent choice-of-anchor J family protein n=1 Tax=Chryseobacterium sp. TaxID=1871047 RepID=UPI001B06A048|nr:choice-of-anchor J domain-containing protein [Chryseobacterium sp.]MBO9690926.1 choice-of-anchor J domain-containing protein [Chryseobacterium sp.]
MKKILLLSAFMGLYTLHAQTTIFQENWDGAGPGIGAWTLYNLDGNTPISAVNAGGDGLPALVTNAWNVLSLSQIQNSGPDYTGFAYPSGATGMSGNVAVSNSWYDPAGVANDWLVSPQISIPAGSTGVNLTWVATSLGASSFLEDYKVYISTTGNQSSNFTTILKTVTNQPNTGSTHTVSLNSYVGQNVYIAFRNDSNDQYIMLLDNIKITGTTPLAVSELAKAETKISVYPNPASDMLIIKSKTKINGAEVFDQGGRKMNTVLDGDRINVKGLASGSYIVTIETKEGTITEKFIKK